MTYTLTTRRPLDPFTSLRRLNQIMDETLGAWTPPSGSWVPSADIVETPGELQLRAELPGVKPEDAKLSVENGVLTLSGEKRSELETKADRAHVLERSFGQFARAFALPKMVDVDRITASFEHGVLTVTLPKPEKALAREIKVNVN
jgi:HSP20 family protein